MDYFVSTTGIDTNAGTLTAPFATIQHGVDQLQPGDRLRIRKGTYIEQVTIRQRNNTTIEPYNGGSVLIDGAVNGRRPDGNPAADPGFVHHNSGIREGEFSRLHSGDQRAPSAMGRREAQQFDDSIIPRLVQIDAPLFRVRSVHSVDTQRAGRPTLRLGNSDRSLPAHRRAPAPGQVPAGVLLVRRGPPRIAPIRPWAAVGGLR